MFTVALSIISFLASTGNLLVIGTFMKIVTLKTSSNYYIVNVAISDLVSVVLDWPLYATEGMLKAGGSHCGLKTRHICLQIKNLFSGILICGVNSELGVNSC